MTSQTEAMVAACWPAYQLAPPTACSLLQDGFNTHYLVATSDGDYVLRVYRRGWRTADDIGYELAALAHLASHGVPVCAPILRQDGTYQCSVSAEEGPRVAVLFPYSHGQAPDPSNADTIRSCGHLLALIHQYTDDFACEHQHFHLNLEHLIEQPLAIILPSLIHRPADADFVQRLAGELHRGLAKQVGGLEWGYCHGDFHGGNVRIDADGKLRVFDFDCGGPGWRAYDLSVCRLFSGDRDSWGLFCQGYKEVRPISAETQRAIPWFAVTRQLWRIGLFSTHWTRLSGSPVNDDFFDHHLAILRDRISIYLPHLAIEL